MKIEYYIVTLPNTKYRYYGNVEDLIETLEGKGFWITSQGRDIEWPDDEQKLSYNIRYGLPVVGDIIAVPKQACPYCGHKK